MVAVGVGIFTALKARWQENTRGFLEIAGRLKVEMPKVQARYGLAFEWRNGQTAVALLRGPFKGKKRITGVRGVRLTFPAGETPPDLSVTEAAERIEAAR